MKVFLWVLFVAFVLLLEKFIRFLFAGGSLTQPARNSTFMYRQIKIVYDRLPERQARFMALYINSAAARNEISESDLRMLVSEFDGKPWEDLCEAYTWLWASCVGHVDTMSIPPTLYSSRQSKIREQIKFANFAVDHGDRRYERMLRAMPQHQVMLISCKTDGAFP